MSEENYQEMYVCDTSGVHPANPIEGMIYENASTGQRDRYTEGEWVVIQEGKK